MKWVIGTSNQSPIQSGNGFFALPSELPRRLSEENGIELHRVRLEGKPISHIQPQDICILLLLWVNLIVVRSRNAYEKRDKS